VGTAVDATGGQQGDEHLDGQDRSGGAGQQAEDQQRAADDLQDADQRDGDGDRGDAPLEEVAEDGGRGGQLREAGKDEDGAGQDAGVEAHVRGIFTRLSLLPAPDDNRRVLAVLAWLRT